LAFLESGISSIADVGLDAMPSAEYATHTENDKKDFEKHHIVIEAFLDDFDCCKIIIVQILMITYQIGFSSVDTSCVPVIVR